MNTVTRVLTALAVCVTTLSASALQQNRQDINTLSANVFQQVYRADSSHCVLGYGNNSVVTRGLVDCAVVCSRDGSCKALNHDRASKTCTMYSGIQACQESSSGSRRVFAWVKSGEEKGDVDHVKGDVISTSNHDNVLETNYISVPNVTGIQLLNVTDIYLIVLTDSINNKIMIFLKTNGDFFTLRDEFRINYTPGNTAQLVDNRAVVLADDGSKMIFIVFQYPDKTFVTTRGLCCDITHPLGVDGDTLLGVVRNTHTVVWVSSGGMSNRSVKIKLKTNPRERILSVRPMNKTVFLVESLDQWGYGLAAYQYSDQPSSTNKILWEVKLDFTDGYLVLGKNNAIFVVDRYRNSLLRLDASKYNLSFETMFTLQPGYQILNNGVCFDQRNTSYVAVTSPQGSFQILKFKLP